MKYKEITLKLVQFTPTVKIIEKQHNEHKKRGKESETSFCCIRSSSQNNQATK